MLRVDPVVGLLIHISSQTPLSALFLNHTTSAEKGVCPNNHNQFYDK